MLRVQIKTVTFIRDWSLNHGLIPNHRGYSWPRTAEHMPSESSLLTSWGITGSQDFLLTARTADLSPLTQLRRVTRPFWIGPAARFPDDHVSLLGALDGAAICFSTGAMTEVWLKLRVYWRQKRTCQCGSRCVWQRRYPITPAAIFIQSFKSGHQVIFPVRVIDDEWWEENRSVADRWSKLTDVGSASVWLPSVRWSIKTTG